MFWLLITIFGYFLNALAVLSDKILLRRSLPHPAAYTFFVSATSALALLALPLSPGVPPLPILVASIGAGLLFTLALYIFYTLLKIRDATEAEPVVGSLAPVFTLLIAWTTIGETLTVWQLIAFTMIVIGTVLLSRGTGTLRTGAITLAMGCAAALCFGAANVLSKYIYTHNAFLNSLIWRTVGSSLGALLLLLFSENRKNILTEARHQKPAIDLAFLFGRLSGAGAFVLTNYAFTLGSVAIVNALSGVQHVFVFIFAFGIAHRFPRALAEHVSPRALRNKIPGILFISLGVGLLFL